MEDVGKFYDIWPLIFDHLVCCSKKNLATLAITSLVVRIMVIIMTGPFGLAFLDFYGPHKLNDHSNTLCIVTTPRVCAIKGRVLRTDSGS
jgi:hypothetical protein